MKNVSNVEFYSGSKEEKLPDFEPDFPYIASRAELDKYPGREVPWHWHKAVEMFYMESGELEYHTPKGKVTFPQGSAGMVNSNVLHMTKAKRGKEKNIQFLHIFDPSFVAGEQGSRIEQKYVMPLVAAGLEIIPLCPEEPAQAEVIKLIRQSFELSEQTPGYEIKLREMLSEIWFRFFEQLHLVQGKNGEYDKVSDKIKSMMIYVHEHYGEKISVTELAMAGFSSERECFRAFQECLHMTPMEYVKTYRLKMACQMLANSEATVTNIGHACGMGSSSHFGKIFREKVGCTPLEYRRKWQNFDR